ncbi:MAG: transposase family protein [Pseudonocardiaceae bacterium]
MDLCGEIDGEATGEERAWPPIRGLFTSLVVTLTYLRRNRVQAELAEAYAVSQSTISRAVSAITPLLGKILKKNMCAKPSLIARLDRAGV